LLKSAADRELNDTEYQNLVLLLFYYQSFKIPLTNVSPLRDQIIIRSSTNVFNFSSIIGFCHSAFNLWLRVQHRIIYFHPVAKPGGGGYSLPPTDPKKKKRGKTRF